ncbi:MAG: hypothetical protein V4773_31115 [Verrucomicrobiota bacterium]
MKTPSVLRLFFQLLLGLAVLWGGGCAHIDTTPAGNPERVLRGAVNFNGSLPMNAEVLVRLIEQPNPDAPRTVTGDQPVVQAAGLPRGEKVLGEYRQQLTGAVMQPVPFEIEYVADDAVLRRGLIVDVRVAVGGKVRLRTVNAHLVTLSSAPFRQEVWVQEVK